MNSKNGRAFDDFEHGGNLYAAARQSGLRPFDFLDFSANINPLGIAPSVKEAIQSGIESVSRYPDPDGWELKDGISQHYKVSKDNIALGNGAAELIYLLCRLIKPSRIVVPAPTFSEYERAGRSVGAEIVDIPLSHSENFQINADTVMETIHTGDLICLCNPNNPTGAILTVDKLEKVIAEADYQNATVMIDESFVDFLPHDEGFSCRKLLDKYDNLFILHSFTKFLAIPGLRLGYMLSSIDFSRQLHAIKDPWNVNMLAQLAGVAGLRDLEYRQKTQGFLQSENIRLYNSLKQISGFRPYPPSVNYILVDISGTGTTVAKLHDQLWKERILIRDCSNFRGLSSGYIRVAVRARTENDKFLQILGTLFGKGDTN